MFAFRSFWKIFRYIFYILFLKNAYNHLLLFLSLTAFAIVLLPIFQTELESLRKTNSLVEKSVPFDLWFKLPRNKIFSKLKSNNPSLLSGANSTQEVAQNIVRNNQQKYDFDSVFVKRVNYVDLENKRYFSLETGFFNNDSAFGEQKFNKVVLKAGRAPSSDPEDLEVVVNSKFADLNSKIKLGSSIKVFGSSLTVVGFGDSVHNLTSDFLNTYKAQQILEVGNDENIFKNFIVAYVHENLFEDFYQKQKFFNNFSNDLYLNFGESTDFEQVKNTFINDIKNSFGYDPEILTFTGDVSSGARTIFVNLSLVTIGALYFFAFILFLVWISFITRSNLFKKNKGIPDLTFFGLSKRTIFFSCFLTNFLLLFAVSFVGCAFSFWIGSYFIDFNNRLSFVKLEWFAFDWVFWLQLLLLPFLWAFLSATFIFFKIGSFSHRWQVDGNTFLLNNETKIRPTVWTVQTKWSIFTPLSSKVKLFFSFLFVNFWRKILLLFFTTSILILFFFLAFAKFSSDNFVFQQWNFLQSDVKSFAKLKEHIFVQQDSRVGSDVDFVATDTLASTDRLERITKFDDVYLNSALFDSDQIIERSLKFWFIDQKIDIPVIRNYMQNFDIETIYFNMLAFDRQQDLLLMIGSANNEKQGANIYFLPPGWKNFFKVAQFDSKLENFQLGKDDTLGVDPEGIQYAIAPYFWKSKGYKLGDIISFEDISFDRITLNRRVEFRIAAFSDKNFLTPDLLFTDYDFLLKQGFITAQPEKKLVYNFVFSKIAKAHFNRYLTLNLRQIDPPTLLSILGGSSGNFDLELLSITNSESVDLVSFKTLSDFHFRLYRRYLFIVLLFGIFILIPFLAIILITLASRNENGLAQMLILGYRTRELIWRLFLSVIILVFTSLVIAFASASLVFSNLLNSFHAMGIYIPFPDVWLYFSYAFAITIPILFVYICYNWLYLKKNFARRLKK